MIKGISYWSTENGLAGTTPIDEAITAVKDAGFQAIELCIAPEGVLTTETPQSECEKIRREIDDAGLILETLASGMSWGFNPTSDDATVRDQAIQLHTAALQRAAWLGCQAMLYVPGVVKSPLSSDLIRYDLALERATEGLKRLLEVAERVRVDLCVENVWNGMFYSPLELADFVDDFKSERLGIYFDVGNGMGYHQHPPHWIELLDKRIRRVHIKDFRENFGFTGGYAFCDLGAGQVPWKQTMDALRAVGYQRTLIAEMMPWDSGLLPRTSAAMDVIMKL